MNLPSLNWRTLLGIGLLLAALLSSWAALRNRDKGPATAGQDVGVDYVLHDFQVVALREHGLAIAGEHARLRAGVDVHVLVAVGGLGKGSARNKETEREYGCKGNLHRGPFYRWGRPGNRGRMGGLPALRLSGDVAGGRRNQRRGV